MGSTFEFLLVLKVLRFALTSVVTVIINYSRLFLLYCIILYDMILRSRRYFELIH